MNILLYDSLLNVYEINKNNTKVIDDIKNQYLKLLSFLTDAPDVPTEQFIKQIIQISKIGTIIICYYYDKDNQNKITIVGSGTIIYEPKIIHCCKNVGHIEDIVIHDSYRGNGIARNIIQILTDYSRKNNCYKVILDCKDDMVEFYEKNGLKETGIQMAKYLQ
jgi:glucosamine-phosphate N-acetyltransferase